MQDGLEIALLAAGMLERLLDAGGFEKIRLTDRGIACLAQALNRNRQALSTHDALVSRVAQTLLRDGRVVWTGLTVRARLPTTADDTHSDAAGAVACATAVGPDFALASDLVGATANRWKICRPDVFSIRNSTVAAYLEPVVHEIKVSRADLLGDLRLRDKRDSYLDLGGQCWYVLGCDAKGRPIAQAHEVPAACGVIVAHADGRRDLIRHAPRRPIEQLPFALWMALAKSTPLPAALAGLTGDEPSQALLDEQSRPLP